MKKIRTLYIGFEEPIAYSELPAFRSAIIEKAGRSHILFHNHISEKNFLYTYPRIQYKIINKQPVIFCINEGIDEIHHFFTKPSWDFFLYDRPYKVKVNRLLVNQFNMNVWEHMFTYQICNWHALNQKNYVKFKTLNSENEQIEMLKKILTGNILSFAKGIDWHITKEVKVDITKILKIKTLSLKKVKIICFDVEFITNVFLPNYIGLGKNVSYGFGIVKQVKQKKYE